MTCPIVPRCQRRQRPSFSALLSVGPSRAAACMVLVAAVCCLHAAPVRGAATAFEDYLATWNIGRDDRAVLEEPAAWSPAKQEMALRVLGRLARVPANLAAAWNEDAVDLGAIPAAERVQDRLVRISGRAVFVAVLPLSEEAAERAGRKVLEQVRIVAAEGLSVDVLADRVPKAWPRNAAIDETSTIVGLPLAEGPGPVVPPAADGPASEPARLLVAAATVGWFPPTPLGTLGMDYGLFDTVVDGQRLVAGDTEAFYATLTAVGRASVAEIAAAAGAPGDIVPLINPHSGWFAEHRGDPVTVEGVARRATRIEIDDPLRREQVGCDHYWELYVFVRTPLLKVHDRLQEDYPVVCCVRTLPAGMPTGEEIGERVRVSGFALKRYGYPLPDVKISSSQGESQREGLRQETALVVGREAAWRPAPSGTREVDTLGWVFLTIAAVIGLAIALAAWAFARDSRHRERQARRELPDRIELP